MHWVFKQRDAWLDKPFFHLEVVRIEPEIYDSETAYELPLWVGYTISAALDDKWYVGSELPEDAQAFNDLWDYRGGIQSSGHYHYAGNSGPDSAGWRRASAFLGKLGLREYQENLDAFIAFDTEFRDHLYEMIVESPEREIEFIEPYDQFDKRFRALENSGQDLTPILRDWLRAQPWVVAEPGAPNVCLDPDLAIPPHPLAERRKEAHGKLHKADVDATWRLFWDRFRERNAD